MRVWGGGIYERDDFYDLCDELGLLVWQDFPFACAAYPEEEPLAAEVEAEARENVTPPAPHPSLVLWNGNNENIWGHAATGAGSEALDGRDLGRAATTTSCCPRIVAELDPTRPYWPGSPVLRHARTCTPNDPRPRHRSTSGTCGTATTTPHYGDYTPAVRRRVRLPGPAHVRDAARRGLATSRSRPTRPACSHHQKADRRQRQAAPRARPAPAAPGGLRRLALGSPSSTRPAPSAFGIEHFRSLTPHCMGTIVWQLNDCWPVTSWAAVDGDGRRKPLWYALRRAYARPAADRPATAVVTAVNDTDEPWTGDLTVTRRAVTGELLAKESVPVSVAPRDARPGRLPPCRQPGRPGRELLDRRARRGTGDPDVRRGPRHGLPAGRSTTPRWSRSPAATWSTSTARTLVRELAIHPDRLDPAATVDDQLVTLLPGETVARSRVATAQLLDPGA